MTIVADFESYPQWNGEVRAVCVLARCREGHYPSPTEAAVHECAHETGKVSASHIDSGNRGLDGASKGR
jgi:hypothetical protein